MVRTLSFLALGAFPFSVHAAPGTGDTTSALLPPDAYSLAQPEKLATPRDAQHANSPLKLAPPSPGTHEAASHTQAELETPLKPSPELLFPTAGPEVLPPRLKGKSLLPIRDERLAEHLIPSLPLHDDSGVAQEAIDTLAESLGEPVWYDPELAETAAKAGADPVAPSSPAPGKRNPRDLLSRSILKMELETTPEFIQGEDGEAMSVMEEMMHETLPELPTHDSADSSEVEYFRR